MGRGGTGSRNSDIGICLEGQALFPVDELHRALPDQVQYQQTKQLNTQSSPNSSKPARVSVHASAVRPAHPKGAPQPPTLLAGISVFVATSGNSRKEEEQRTKVSASRQKEACRHWGAGVPSSRADFHQQVLMRPGSQPTCQPARPWLW